MTTGSGPAACAWESNPRSLQHSSFSGAVELMRVAQVKVRQGGPEVPVSIALLQSALIPQMLLRVLSRQQFYLVEQGLQIIFLVVFSTQLFHARSHASHSRRLEQCIHLQIGVQIPPQ